MPQEAETQWGEGRRRETIMERQALIQDVLPIGSGWYWEKAVIVAALVQVLKTRLIEAGVYHIRQDPRCRLCTCWDSAAYNSRVQYAGQHSITGASNPSSCCIIQKHLHKVWTGGFRVKVDNISKGENDRAKILWDFQMVTIQLDIVVADKQEMKVVVVDITIPSVSKITKKKNEKLQK